MIDFIWRRVFVLGGLLLFLMACGSPDEVAVPTVVPETAVTNPTSTPSDPPPTPTEEALTEPTSAPADRTPIPVDPTPAPAEDSVRQLTILYTNDEHGWMEGQVEGEGAANLMGIWRDQEGYTNDGSFLILSGGDLWTGPAISTWFEGESMAEVMNEMGYTATAVGNHEFDFGLDVLKKRISDSTFPFLSANMRYKSDGSAPTDLGIYPYVIIEANGIMVGIMGLTTVTTPFTTNPVNVADFEFIDYETAVRETVPQMKAEGAELILVPGHICRHELLSLASDIADMGVHLLGGGHCNELFATEQNGFVLLEGGSSMAGYARATFQFDTATDTVIEVEYGTQTNMNGAADPTIEAIVQNWQGEASEELNVVIGYTENGIERRSQEMQQLMTESWLIGYPIADVAITNLGGMRDAFAVGEITLGAVIGVMPFNNVIIEVSLTGEQLVQVLALARGDAAIGGAHRSGSRWILHKTGEEIDPTTQYSLLVNDFMYAGGDGYELLAEFDPDAYNTAIDWRQPVIDWMIAQDSSAERPLDDAMQQLELP